MRPEQVGVVEGYLLDRLPFVLAIGYVPDMTAAERANELAEFVGQLNGYPVWTLAEALDKWIAQHNRRPSANELLILCNRAQDPITTEIANRKKLAARQAEDERRRELTPAELDRRREHAARTLQEFGFSHLIPRQADT